MVAQGGNVEIVKLLKIQTSGLIFIRLLSRPDINFFIISGDLGGQPNAIPAFYDKQENVTLIGTGMGEVIDENFIIATIKESAIHFEVVPLSEEGIQHPLEYYNTENMLEYYNPKIPPPFPFKRVIFYSLISLISIFLLIILLKRVLRRYPFFTR